MSDFAKFCPKCYAFFRDPDLYAKHVEVCGFAKKKETEPVKEPKKAAGKETADGRQQTAAEVKKVVKRQTAEKKSPVVEEGAEQVGVENESSDSSLLTPDSSPTPSADSAEGSTPPAVAPKSQKFKT